MGFIYMCTSPSGKAYVGQTTRTFEKRWKEHCSIEKPETAFGRALIKYGSKNFRTKVLLEVNDELLNHYEEAFVLAYGTFSPRGYNLTTGGGQFKHAEATKRKIADAHRKRALIHGPPFAGVKRATGFGVKGVAQYDYRGNLIAEFPSRREAARSIGVWEGAIALCIRGGYGGKHKSVGGYLWSNLGEHPPEYERPDGFGRAKTVGQYSVDDRLIATFRSVGQASKHTGIAQATIAYCARGQSKTSGGFAWKYL